VRERRRVGRLEAVLLPAVKAGAEDNGWVGAGAKVEGGAAHVAGLADGHWDWGACLEFRGGREAQAGVEGVGGCLTECG